MVFPNFQILFQTLTSVLSPASQSTAVGPGLKGGKAQLKASLQVHLAYATAQLLQVKGNWWFDSSPWEGVFDSSVIVLYRWQVIRNVAGMGALTQRGAGSQSSIVDRFKHRLSAIHEVFRTEHLLRLFASLLVIGELRRVLPRTSLRQRCMRGQSRVIPACSLERLKVLFQIHSSTFCNESCSTVVGSIFWCKFSIWVLLPCHVFRVRGRFLWFKAPARVRQLLKLYLRCNSRAPRTLCASMKCTLQLA